MTKTIRLLQLYPKDMNIYGDWGNTLVIKRRLEWSGYTVELLEHNPGNELPSDIDLITGGGGQDSGQNAIQGDLQKIGPKLINLANQEVPMLMVCGMYQLFGKFFKTSDGEIIKGIGLLDIETFGSKERMIGNIATKSELFGDIIGYENHSGRTYLGKGVEPLGQVHKGAGNNGKDATEGAIYKHVIGTYLHGSLLPKNPAIADWMIEQAVTRKYGDFSPNIIDDSFANKARDIALARPR